MAESFFQHAIQGHTIWHETFMLGGAAGILLYIGFLWCFFTKNYHRKVSLLAILLSQSFIIFVIMFHANWIFGDDHIFITTTAINQYIPVHIYPSIGRFNPVGFIEYNIMLFLFRLFGIDTGIPVTVHLIFPALYYLLTIVCLYLLVDKINSNNLKQYPAINLFFLCLFPLLSFGFQLIFMDVIFFEPLLIMLFSFFMLMYYKGLKTDKTKYYIAALITGVYATYCKEPVFGSLLIIAFFNHLFRYKDETKTEKWFYMALIINSILFVVLYYFLSYKYITIPYNENRNIFGISKFIVIIFIKTPILAVMFLTGCIRLYYIVIKRDRTHPCYDSLLFAGMAYTFAYVLLGLNAEYYFTPSVILCLPSVIYWTKYFNQKKIKLSFILLFAITVICDFNLIVEVKRGRDTLRNRRDFIPYITNLLSEYNEGKTFIWYESDNTIMPTYQIVQKWKKNTENAFLNYMNKTKDKEFFEVCKNIDEVNFDKNILFFYPLENNEKLSIHDDILKILDHNNFELYSDLNGILIYKCEE
jgi:hypothetical protein